MCLQTVRVLTSIPTDCREEKLAEKRLTEHGEDTVEEADEKKYMQVGALRHVGCGVSGLV
jgi:hypothetical protein